MAPLIIGIVLLVLIVAVIAWCVGQYNKLIKLGLRVDNAFSQINVVLQQRHDLIPNLVNTVKGYATHEKETLDAVISARAAAVNAPNPDAQIAAEGGLTAALSKLMMVTEAYPDLKANQSFQQLMGQLTDQEQKIAVSRQIYNDTVQTYNTAGKTFPTMLFAGIAQFKAREFFAAPQEAQVAPEVNFDAPVVSAPTAAAPAPDTNPTA